MRYKVAIVGSLLISACSSDKELSVLSSRIDVCASLPKGVSYEFVHKAVDYDIGRIVAGNAQAEIYFGYQPDFPAKKVDVPELADGIFHPAGELHGKMLLSRRDDVRGSATFILMTTDDAKRVREIFYKKDMFRSCKKSKAMD